MPTPRSESRNRGFFFFSRCSLKSSYGIWVRMPAPSPVTASASMAPRCASDFSAAMAFSTTSWERSPEILAMNPTPQASCSKSGL